MTKTAVDITISLGSYIIGPNDGPRRAWVTLGSTCITGCSQPWTYGRGGQG